MLKTKFEDKIAIRVAPFCAMIFSFSLGCAAAPAKSEVPKSAPTSAAQANAELGLPEQAPAAKIAAGKTAPRMRSVSESDIAALKAINEKYRTSSSVTADVAKDVKLGLIGGERKSSGKLYLSKGQLRMELEGSEKTLLVVNKKNLYAVTYPDPQLKGAATQVIEGATNSKKAQSQALTTLLGSSGFLKTFSATAVRNDVETGTKTYFLQPKKDQADFTRAQLTVSGDEKEIRELHYWDTRDNETILTLSNTKFGEKLDSKLFNYTPPADADVMKL